MIEYVTDGFLMLTDVTGESQQGAWATAFPVVPDSHSLQMDPLDAYAP